MIRWAAIALGGLLILAIAFLAVTSSLVSAPKIQGTVAQWAGQALGRPVKFASLSLAFLPLPALRLTKLEVAEDPKFGPTPFLTVETGHAGLRLWPLLAGRVEVTELTLERPQVALIQASGGQWNVASLGARRGGVAPPPKGSAGSPAGSLLPPISRVRVVGATVLYEVRSKLAAPVTYLLEGLGLTVSGLALGVPIEFDGETRLTPGNLWLRIAGGSLIPEDGHSLAEWAVNADLEVSAEDIAPLVRGLLGPVPELAGPVRGKLALSGTLARPTVRGVVELPRLKLTEHRSNCPEPKTRSLTLETVRLPLAYAPFRLMSHPLSARLGGGSASVAVALDFAPQPFLRLSKISVKAVPLAPVLVDYLCQGYAVSGPLDLTGELSAGPGDPVRTLAGQGQLRIGAGRMVGLEALALLGEAVRMSGALAAVLNWDLPQSLFASPLTFDSITASYRIADGRLTTRDFLYSSARLKVKAAGEYGIGDGRMNLELVLTSGRGEITARVTGTAGAPAIRLRTPQRILQAGPERLRRLLRALPGQLP